MVLRSPALPLLLAAAFLAGCLGARAQSGTDTWREKGFSESRSTRETLDASFDPRRIALVVGNNVFDDSTFPPLSWAENDAAEVGRILEDPTYGGFDRVVYLLGDKARRDRVLSELVSLRNDLRRQDTLVVFISSHGTMKLDAQGAPQLFLVARDTRPADLRGSAIELGELQRFFSEIRAERKALILDACYNGEGKSALQPTVRQRVARMEDTPPLSRKVRLGESEAHLFASTVGRPAREDDTLKHGVFTYHLLEGMTWNQDVSDANADGVVTSYEAHDYARARTIEYTLGAQIPEAYFRVVGFNDLALVGTPDERAKVEAGLIYNYGDGNDELAGAVLFIDGREKGVFPGTYSVAAGRHRVRIVGDDGSVIQDRLVAFAPFEPVSAQALKSRPRIYSGFLGAAPEVRFSFSEALHPLVGRAHVGVQVRGGYRFVGRADGLTLEARGSYAPHSAKFVNGDAVTFQSRHIARLGAGVGWRGLLPGAMLGVGYRITGTVVSGLDDPSCAGVTACDSWLYLSHAVAVEESFTLGRRWSLHLAQELGVTALDSAGTGDVRPAVDFGLTLGIEVGL